VTGDQVGCRQHRTFHIAPRPLGHDPLERDNLRVALFDYIEVFYNRERHQAGLGHDTPAGYETVTEAA
jgi:hypothetical protein